MQDNEKMGTLSERTEDLRARGYTGQFKVDGARLCLLDSKSYYNPDQLTITEHYRFEGDSDPGDMSVIYAIDANDGNKGTLTDGFGTYSDKAVSDFIVRIKDLHKGDIY